VIVQVVIMLTVLLGCLAFAVDVGYIYDLRGSMQTGVDASSLAGASGLREGQAAAKNRARDYAAKNYVAKVSIKPNELTMTVGNWYGLTATFVPADGAEVVRPNAIRVRGHRPDVPLFFAGVLGDTTTDVAKFATAVGGGGQCLGVWGMEGVTASGDIMTDSYDLRLGDYGPGRIYANGDICTCDDMTLGGNTEVHGDAMYGTGDDLTLHGSSYQVWGLIGPNDCNLVPPPFDMALAASENDNDLIPLTDDGDDPLTGPDRLFLTGNDNLTLPPGKYYFTSVRIVSLATLTITGPTEIYVEGDADFGGGGIINNTGDPTNLKIFCTGNTINFSGTSDFFGGIVAPDTDINFLGDSTVYGVVIGKTLDFRGNTFIHVEESLVAELHGLESVSPILVE
jgi:hypothetical protein